MTVARVRHLRVVRQILMSSGVISTASSPACLAVDARVGTAREAVAVAGFSLT